MGKIVRTTGPTYKILPTGILLVGKQILIIAISNLKEVVRPLSGLNDTFIHLALHKIMQSFEDLKISFKHDGSWNSFQFLDRPT